MAKIQFSNGYVMYVPDALVGMTRELPNPSSPGDNPEPFVVLDYNLLF